MTGPMKSTVAVLALVGAVFTSAALANEGPGNRGAMMLEMFDVMDADKDGKVTIVEIEAHRLARFAEADTNSDGSLSAEELAAQHLARMTERSAEHAAKMLQWQDANGDGMLSADEMPGGPSPRMLARLDSDNDGAISKAEAEAAMEHMGKRKHGKGRMWGGDDN